MRLRADSDNAGGANQSWAVTGRNYLVIGAALFVLVALLGLGAWALNDRLRPPTGLTPLATATVAPATAVSAAAVSSPTAQAGVATPTLPIAVAAAPEAKEVEAAFQKYLQIYSDAVYNLDTSRLPEVLDGKALQLVTQEVNDLKAKGWPAKVIEEDRGMAFGNIGPDHVTLIDIYISKSVYVDPKTKELLPRTDPPIRVQQSYEFRKINGVWKIVDGTRKVLGEVR